MTKKDLLELLEPLPMSHKVMLEANESGYQFSDINSVRRLDVDYEHSDEMIEEMEVIVLSEQ